MPISSRETMLHVDPRPPDPPGAIDHWLQSEKLQQEFETARQGGDTAGMQRAQAAMRRAAQAQAPELARLAALARQADAPRGRPPKKGEEAKLASELERIASERSKLEARKNKLLAKAASSRDDNELYEELHGLDRDLTNLDYREQGVRLALGQIEAWKRDQEREQRLQASLAARKKAEADRKAAIASLDKLAADTAEHWQQVVKGLAEIEAKARELHERPGRWHGKLLDESGARELQGRMCGIPSPSVWCFPDPTSKR
jgi:hypothetical protein